MRAIIIHGTKGSSQGNWYPWLASELQKLRVETIVPQMPTPENQTLDSWRKTFKEYCGEISRDDILIGHSCGAVLLLRLLEESAQSAAFTVLVSPPFGEIGVPEYDALNSSFLDKPFDWSEIISKTGRLAYLMADNDQYVPQEQLLEVASSLNVKPLIIKGGGHLNSETGFTTFPQLLYLLNRFLEDRKTTNS